MTSDGCTGGGSIPIGTVPYDVSGLSAGITDIGVWPIGVRLISRRLICIPRAIVIIVIIVATSRSTISTIHLLDLLSQLLYSLEKLFVQGVRSSWCELVHICAYGLLIPMS